MGNIDLGLAVVPVPAIAAIDIGAFDGDTGQPLDLLDLSAQRMAVIGTARKGLHPDNELAACGARIGHRDRGLDPELVSGARFPLGDAFDLGGVERVKLVGIARSLGKDPCDAFACLGKGSFV